MRVEIPSVLAAITRFQASNAGAVNPTGAQTQLTSIDMGLCVVNQLVIVTASMVMVKGGTLGDSNHGIFQPAGTGVIQFLNALGFAENALPAHPVGLTWEDVITLLGVITTAGTVTLASYARSLGSNGAVGIGGAQINAIRINR